MTKINFIIFLVVVHIIMKFLAMTWATPYADTQSGSHCAAVVALGNGIAAVVLAIGGVVGAASAAVRLPVRNSVELVVGQPTRFVLSCCSILRKKGNFHGMCKV